MIRLLVLFLGLISLSFTPPAQAHDLTTAETEILPRIIDSVCIDMVNDSNGCEQTLVLASQTEPDRADLVILRDRRTQPPSEPLLIARNIVFNGAMWGMAPTLQTTQHNSLLLTSQQIGLGRRPWTQTYTIAYRDGRFVLAGFTYSTYDRIMGGNMDCDVNLRTGDYVVNATTIDPETEQEIVTLSDTGRIEPMNLDIAHLGENALFPAPCNAGLAAMENEPVRAR